MQGKTGKNELCVYIEAHKPTSMSTLENYPAPGLLYVNLFMIIWLNKSAIKYMLHVSIVSSEELKLDFDTEPHNKTGPQEVYMQEPHVEHFSYYTALLHYFSVLHIIKQSNYNSHRQHEAFRPPDLSSPNPL